MDLAARNALVEQFLPFVRKIAAYYARRAPHVCPFEDLAQAGAVALIRAAGSYDAARGPFVAYAGLAVRREISRTQAALGRVLLRQSPLMEQLLPDRPGPAGVEVDTRDRIAAALRALHPRQRLAVELRLRGLTTEEAAPHLGVTRQRVHQLQQAALGRLRRSLSRDAPPCEDAGPCPGEE